MKKILIVADSLGCGGAEKSLCNLLSIFDYSRYEVHLQLSAISENVCQMLSPNVKILNELDYFRDSKNSLIKQIFDKRFFTRLKVFFGLKKQKGLHSSQRFWALAQKGFSETQEVYDVAIAWGQGFPVYFTMGKIKAKKKIAFINANCFAQGYNKEFDFKFFSKYDNIIAVSKFLEEKLRKEYPLLASKFLTIYDIVKVDEIIEKANRGNPFVGDGDIIKIVTVGRLVKEKGYDLAIEASVELLKNELNFRWYIVGDGRERENIEQSIKAKGLNNHMFLLGAQENPYPYVKNADVYVQCSRNEGFCLTLKEAKILNKPIISTNFETASLQIVNEENGLVVEMSGQDIARGIIRIIKDEGLSKKFRINLQKEINDNQQEIEKLYRLIEN